MLKNSKGGLDQYGPKHFEVQPFDIIGLERVKTPLRNKKQDQSATVTINVFVCALHHTVLSVIAVHITRLQNYCRKVSCILLTIINCTSLLQPL